MPFCYSVVWLTIPEGGHNEVDLAAVPWWWSSTYVEDPEETLDLIAAVDVTLGTVLADGAQLVGHQLSSDLGVLAGAAIGRQPIPGVITARTAWHDRRNAQGRPVLDTRYDTDDLLVGHGRSRRLVDVCTTLGLNVTQPELRGISMTALHRRWHETGNHEARERITVLNLRHSLSTGLVAARACTAGRWQEPLNVNSLLAAELRDRFIYLSTPTFRALL